MTEIVSADALNEGQWDLLLSSSGRRLIANTITTANAAISVRAGNTIFRSANVNGEGHLEIQLQGNAHVDLVSANVGKFGACVLDGDVSGQGVSSIVSSGLSDIITSGAVFDALPTQWHGAPGAAHATAATCVVWGGGSGACENGGERKRG